jgi:ABC-type dipeptide/oligopeptide/nickel transport system permease subunit
MSIQQRLEIDAALWANLAALHDGWFDLFAVLILVLTALFSCLHAFVRIAFAFLGLALWTLALLITFLYWLRFWAVSRSSSTLYGRNE